MDIKELDKKLKALGLPEYARDEIIHEMMGIKTIVEMNGVALDSTLKAILRVV